MHQSANKFLCSFSSLLQNNTDVRLGAIPSMPMIFSKQLFPCWLLKRLKKKKKKKDTCWEKKSQKKKGCCNQVRTEKLEKWCATIPKWVGAWGTRSHKFRKGLKPSTQGNNYPLTDCGNIEVRQHEGFFPSFWCTPHRSIQGHSCLPEGERVVVSARLAISHQVGALFAQSQQTFCFCPAQGSMVPPAGKQQDSITQS